MKKRILSVLLAIVMVVGLLPIVALAVDSSQEEHKHCVCGVSCTHNSDHADVEWTEIVEGTNLIRHDAYSYCYKLDTQKTHYYLSGDLSLPTPAGYNINYPLKITQNTYLCLGGYSLSGGVVVENGATLYLCDCKGTGKISKSGGRGVEVKSGRFVMYSGSIANCSSPFNTHGAGVYVGSGGRFDMYDGTIESCSTENNIMYPTSGGGVYVTGTGVFNMNDGLIDSCTANKGGGVAAGNGGTFNMNGGTIQDCSINSYHTNRGGGVYITENGNFTMSGGTIINCSASMGGGVYADSTAGSFTLAGGSITGCASSGHTYYGAVYLNSANMTVSGEVTIQGTGDGDLTICKGHNTNGVITFTGNGKLAENIRSCRKDLGLTQEQLAERLGITLGTISKWERGNSEPDLGYLMELAGVFHRSVDALIGFSMQGTDADAEADRL